MLQLKEEDHQSIRRLAESIYPYECCGFLIGTNKEGIRSVDRIQVAENRRHDSPENRYLITPEQFREIEEDLRSDDRQIIGFFHSHPDAEAQPSSYDLDYAWPWFSYLIVSVKNGSSDTLTAWRLEEDRSCFRREKIGSLRS